MVIQVHSGEANPRKFFERVDISIGVCLIRHKTVLELTASKKKGEMEKEKREKLISPHGIASSQVLFCGLALQTTYFVLHQLISSTGIYK